VPCAVGDRIDDQPAIKRRERAAMRACEREQIGIGHLICRKDPARIDVLCIKQAHVVSPELVAGMCSQLRHERCDSGRRLECVRVTRIADDAQHAVFGQWAGRPRYVPGLAEPCMRRLMLHVAGVEQCDQDVHVEQIRHQEVSSRN
jgi:hypothetical protein